VKLLEAKRALRYGLYQLTGISDRELFDHRASLAKAGRHIVGALYLPDGTGVGTVLSMFSMPTQGADAAAEISGTTRAVTSLPRPAISRSRTTA
jgi:hypothetical protein